jgi:RNA-binding protein 39
MNLDVEALLDSTAAAPVDKSTPDRTDKSDRRARDSSKERDAKRRDRSRSRDRKHDRDGDIDMKSPLIGSDKGSTKSRRRSRSPDRDRGVSRRERRRDSPDRGGDFYRGGGRPRTRSVSPDGSRYYRPNASARRTSREREHTRDRNSKDREEGRAGHRGDRRGRDGRERDGRRGTPDRRDRRDRQEKSKSPVLTDDDRDRRTVFVQQLAARLRSTELAKFFSKAGAVKDAQIVKDRVSGRSKG